MPRFYHKFLKLAHKQHGRHASAISSYTVAEQKVSKQQLIKVPLRWLELLGHQPVTLFIHTLCSVADSYRGSQ